MNTKGIKSRSFRSLSFTLAITFLGLGAVIIFLNNGVNIYFNFQKERTIIAADQRRIADDAATTVKLFIQKKLTLLRTAITFDNPMTLTSDRQKLLLDMLLSSDPAFRQITILSVRNTELMKASRLLGSVPMSIPQKELQMLIASVRKNKDYISTVYFDTLTQEPLVVMAVPIRNVFGDYQGAVLTETNLKYMWDIFGGIKIGGKGLAYVIDRQGNLLAFGDIGRVLRRENVRQLTEVRQFMRTGNENGEEAIETSTGIQGTQVVSTFAPLGFPDWAVVSEIPVWEAYQNLLQQVELSVVIMLVSAAIGFGVTIYFSRRITRPITHLTEVVEKVSAGDLSQHAVAMSEDEVGVLASAFNLMVNSLKTASDGLEEKVREKTAQLEQKIALAIEQNKSLEDTKRATLNLLEDSRELETQLENERDRAKAILTSMGEGLVVVNKNSEILLTNPAAEVLLEIRFDDVKNKNLLDYVTIYAGDIPLVLDERPLHKTLIDRKVHSAGLDDNYFYVTKSGKKFPVAINTAPLLEGDAIAGAIVVFRDITSEKEVKDRIEKLVEDRTLELHEEQARLEASINSLNVGFIMTDNKKNIITMNGTAKRLLFRQVYEKLTPAEVINNLDKQTTLQEIQTQLKDGFNLEDTVERCFNEKKPIDMRDILMGEKYLHIFMSPIVILKERLEIIGTVVMVEDTTEEKVLQRSRDEFFSIASHELRTPLTAIKGNTSMIRDMYPEVLKDPDLKSMIEDIYEASKRLIDIVNEFLNMSRLEQGRMVFKNEPFPLVDLVEGSVKDILTIAEGKNIFLKLEGDISGIPQTMADKDKTKEVLMNLLGNAVKFTEKGGVTVRMLLDEKMVKVVISDTGKGIPLNNQNLLFRKFQQASNNILTRDSTQSTGLGLYIAKLMMEGMGGKLYLEHSEENVGSTFVIALPVASK